MLRLGFTYNNIHSSKFDIYFFSKDRTVLPPTRRQSKTIPNRHGDFPQEKKIYSIRTIILDIFVEENSLPNLRQKIRDIASWLSDDGSLIFDDEPDKAYDARIEELVNLEQLITYGQMSIPFICQPFAYRQPITKAITSGRNKLDYQGTAESPTFIILKNNQPYPISNIKITLIKTK